MTNDQVMKGSGALTAPLPGTTNTRDLGGLPTTGGRIVAHGRLFRGDVLGPVGSSAECCWSDEHAPTYRELGLRLVVDLRSEAEAEVELVPSAWGTGTGARLLHAPVPEGVEGTETDFMRMLRDGLITRFGPADLGVWYSQVFDRRADVFGRVIAEIADPTGRPTLIHCHAGKDRTGLVIALILGVLGVPREAILADYTVTGVNRRHVAEQAEPLVAELGLVMAEVRTFFESPPLALSTALDYLDREYGGAAGYLQYGGAAGYLQQAGGVAPEQLVALRQGLITDP
ncbi:protein tyrosine phosphatase [Gordonia paraffinivorans]|uniref:tyrosine-protein phosphatase n=1 Tax=Gordonia paraffinivorans TaxID=175628 RepID=UPI001C92E906|nr:tyrosine-protein phosphatase [Gordonia paraffinivorans]MBY4575637.1 protein tyrosine phosphatase [Gordonia paraffinivorans]